MSGKTIDDVKAFWESNPLFAEESSFPVGSREFFSEHRLVYIQDCFAGKIDERIYPDESHRNCVLDLGCGPGFWVIELAQKGIEKIVAADLTDTALRLTQRRAKIFNVHVETSLQNAEELTFASEMFSHVNCQGVIHHTPDTEKCVREIARVLRHNGTAVISVYYRNLFIRLWPVIKYFGKVLSKFMSGLKGRGREKLFSTDDVNELVRLFDGELNPIGKVYSKQQFIGILSAHFKIDAIFFHFFPARAIPFNIPGWLHKFLDEKTGFMIFASCRKLAIK